VTDGTDAESERWYCAHCEEDLHRGDDALACDDPDECPYSAEWGGDACGYIVCRHCHRPAEERRAPRGRR
jgi:hypothetical protein